METRELHIPMDNGRWWYSTPGRVRSLPPLLVHFVWRLDWITPEIAASADCAVVARRVVHLKAVLRLLLRVEVTSRSRRDFLFRLLHTKCHNYNNWLSIRVGNICCDTEPAAAAADDVLFTRLCIWTIIPSTNDKWDAGGPVTCLCSTGGGGGGDCDMNAAECKEPGELSMTVNGTGKWSA